MLRLFGARLGKGCHVYPGARIWAPWNIRLGSHVGVADGVVLYSMSEIVVGDYAVLSQGVHLCCGTHDYQSPNFELLSKPIEVGRYAWLCADVFVHPGIKIPEGAVVGARSVVTKTPPKSWTVYAGNPCLEVRARKNTAEGRQE
jgi:putative colanic acid biosynthesis acetyltransferase WcaF